MTDRDPRYPIGRPDPRAPLDPGERSAMIDRIASLPARLADAVAGWPDDRLDTPYREGGWTVRQVIHHLPDSHANGYVRFKLAVTESRPQVRPYQEAVWAELPEAKTGPLDLSLPLLSALHRRWTVFMRGLPAEAWARTAVYSDGRELALDQMLCIYSWHGDHHLAQIEALADREGW